MPTSTPFTLALLLVGLACLSDTCCARDSGDLILRGRTSIYGPLLPLYNTEYQPICHYSATALGFRSGLKEFSTSGSYSARWGPNLRNYPTVTATEIGKCNPATWAMTRLLKVIDDTVNLGLNYCHHHAPSYLPPAAERIPCDNDAPATATDCTCNAAGLSRPRPWQGVDCSNFVAYVYNFAFGYYPTSAVGSQACEPKQAPGRFLTGLNPDHADAFLPGDLLYIKATATQPGAPVRVSHVVMWTGIQVDFTPGATGPFAYDTLIDALPAKQRPSAIAYIQARQSSGLPVYVIADSTNTGPGYRPFAGWYTSSFSHGRRIINPDRMLSREDPSVARWNAATQDCIGYAMA